MTKRNRREMAKWATANGVVGLVLGSQNTAQAQLKLSAFDQVRSVDLRSNCLRVTDPNRALDKQKFPPHGYSIDILYQVTVPELREGDILSVAAESEVTSKLNYTLQVASFVTLGKENDSPTALYASGKHICFPAGSNLIKGLQNLFFTRTGSVRVDVGAVKLDTVFFLGYSVSDASDPDHPHCVTVERGYGHLSVIHIRPVNI